MFYDSINTWWWPFVFIAITGFLPTSIWRWAGVLLVGDLDENSQGLIFIRCIATSLVAAVIAQLLFSPTGALADVPLFIRVGSALLGFGAFLISGRIMAVGIITGEVLLLLGMVLGTS